jgi:hypothetical protein
MSTSNFTYKVCEKISDEELLKVYIMEEKTMDMVYTDKVVIEKIWNGCFKHGYIKQTYDVWLNKLIIRI